MEGNARFSFGPSATSAIKGRGRFPVRSSGLPSTTETHIDLLTAYDHCSPPISIPQFEGFERTTFRSRLSLNEILQFTRQEYKDYLEEEVPNLKIESLAALDKMRPFNIPFPTQEKPKKSNLIPLNSQQELKEKRSLLQKTSQGLRRSGASQYPKELESVIPNISLSPDLNPKVFSRSRLARIKRALSKKKASWLELTITAPSTHQEPILDPAPPLAPLSDKPTEKEHMLNPTAPEFVPRTQTRSSRIPILAFPPPGWQPPSKKISITATRQIPPSPKFNSEGRQSSPYVSASLPWLTPEKKSFTDSCSSFFTAIEQTQSLTDKTKEDDHKAGKIARKPIGQKPATSKIKNIKPDQGGRKDQTEDQKVSQLLGNKNRDKSEGN